MTTKILSCIVPEYDPTMSHDGGSYFCPSGTVVVCTDSHRLYTVDIDDSSCGDFGIRRDIAIRTVGGVSWKYHLDSMNPDMNEEDRLWSDRNRWYAQTTDDLYEVYTFAWLSLQRGGVS